MVVDSGYLVITLVPISTLTTFTFSRGSVLSIGDSVVTFVLNAMPETN